MIYNRWKGYDQSIEAQLDKIRGLLLTQGQKTLKYGHFIALRPV